MLEITEKDKKYYINCPFKLKDSLKSAIPSAKWDRAAKSWYVGPRSKGKLEAWVAEHNEEAGEIEQAKKEFEQAIASMKPLKGHTFDIKDELKTRFNATYSGGNWLADKNVHSEAQAFVDTYNEGRNKKIITKEMLGVTELEAKLKTMEAVIDNFDEGTGLYKYYDDEFAQRAFSSYEYNDKDKAATVRRDVLHIFNEIGQYLSFADETDNPGIFFGSSLQNMLRTFGLPLLIHVNFEDVSWCNYCDIEEAVIHKLLDEKKYKTVDDDHASKELDDASHPPSYSIHSKKTGAHYGLINAFIDIERRQSSSRVHIYSAKGIPVLNDDNYETHVRYWQNKSRSGCVLL